MTDRLAEIEHAIEGGKMAAVSGVITVLDTEKAEWLIDEVKRLRIALAKIAFGDTGHFEESPRGIAARALELTDEA